jgi:hypothetical protein
VPQVHWIPVVTFWQVTWDMIVALEPPPEHGHHDGVELPTAWAAVLHPAGPKPKRPRSARGPKTRGPKNSNPQTVDPERISPAAPSSSTRVRVHDGTAEIGDSTRPDARMGWTHRTGVME